MLSTLAAASQIAPNMLMSPANVLSEIFNTMPRHIVKDTNI